MVATLTCVVPRYPALLQSDIESTGKIPGLLLFQNFIDRVGVVAIDVNLVLSAKNSMK